MTITIIVTIKPFHRKDALGTLGKMNGMGIFPPPTEIGLCIMGAAAAAAEEELPALDHPGAGWDRGPNG